MNHEPDDLTSLTEEEETIKTFFKQEITRTIKRIAITTFIAGTVTGYFVAFFTHNYRCDNGTTTIKASDPVPNDSGDTIPNRGSGRRSLFAVVYTLFN